MINSRDGSYFKGRYIVLRNDLYFYSRSAFPSSSIFMTLRLFFQTLISLIQLQCQHPTSKSKLFLIYICRLGVNFGIGMSGLRLHHNGILISRTNRIYVQITILTVFLWLGRALHAIILPHTVLHWIHTARFLYFTCVTITYDLNYCISINSILFKKMYTSIQTQLNL